MAVLKDLIVHGNSRFIDIAHFDKLKSNHLAADMGIFNKLVAVEASIDELEAGDLTAQSATVVGLLDVRGQLKTNSWTNSNIAAIEGNFYITPTLSAESSDNSIIEFTYDSENLVWEATIAGEFAVNQVGADRIEGEQNNAVQWSKGSKVLITGDIEKTDATYPLGTLVGYIKNTPIVDSETGNAQQIEVTNLTDNLGNTDIFDEIIADENSNSVYSYTYQNIKISLTQRYYGTGQNVNDGFYPIGILLAAQGRASKSFIDIYGGANLLHEDNLDIQAEQNNTSDYGGLAIPKVRIGNLRGLPNIKTGDFTNDAALPTGWGIYTDNGYFSGTIVSTYGEIGGFSIGPNDLSNGTLGSEQSVMISTGTIDLASIGGSKSINNWAFTAGNQFGVTADGTLYATKANITGEIIASKLTIQNNDGALYNGVTALESSRYSIEIKQDATDSSDSKTKTYLYPTLYYNGNVIDVNDSDFIWYNASEEISLLNPGTPGGPQGRFEANYESTYKVIYRIDNDTIISQTITPVNPMKQISKYITEITDGGISIHAVKTNENDLSGLRVEITGERLSFYQNEQEVAYIDSNQLYITKSVVLQQMEVGSPMVEDNIGGQWSWQVRQTENGNNLHLKWLG